jgi:hypothetical protein
MELQNIAFYLDNDFPNSGVSRDFVDSHNAWVWEKKNDPWKPTFICGFFTKKPILYDKCFTREAAQLKGECSNLGDILYMPYAIGKNYTFTEKEHSGFVITPWTFCMFLRYPRKGPNFGEIAVATLEQLLKSKGRTVYRDKHVSASNNLYDRDDLCIDGLKAAGYDFIFDDERVDFSLGLQLTVNDKIMEIFKTILANDSHFAESEGAKKGIGHADLNPWDILNALEDTRLALINNTYKAPAQTLTVVINKEEEQIILIGHLPTKELCVALSAFIRQKQREIADYATEDGKGRLITKRDPALLNFLFDLKEAFPDALSFSEVKV